MTGTNSYKKKKKLKQENFDTNWPMTLFGGDAAAHSKVISFTCKLQQETLYCKYGYKQNQTMYVSHFKTTKVLHKLNPLTTSPLTHKEYEVYLISNPLTFHPKIIKFK